MTPKSEAWRVTPGVRAHAVDGHVVLFNTNTGQYFALTGLAADLWVRMCRGDEVLPTEPGYTEPLELLRSHSLIHGSFDVPLTQPSAPSANASVRLLSEFDHLILREPEIDHHLLDSPRFVNVADPHRRQLVERVQVRKFVDSLFVAADRYAASRDMITFSMDLAGTSVRINVPSSDEHQRIPIRDAFFPSTPVTGVAPPYETTVTVIDDADGPRQFDLDFAPDWHFPLGVLSSARSSPFRVAIDRHTQSISVYSPSARKCVVWMPRFSDMPYWSAATPLRLQLSWIADQLGTEFLHAAGIRVGNQAVLFGGPSGSGKSTLALRLAQRGHQLIGDDFLLARGTTVQAVFRRLKVHDWSAERVLPPGWATLNPPPLREKRIIDPGNDLFAMPLQIRALVIPTVSSGISENDGSLRPISAGEALTRMAPPSLAGLLGGNEESLPRIGHLLETVPCFSLIMNESLLDDTARLDGLIATLVAQR